MQVIFEGEKVILLKEDFLELMKSKNGFVFTEEKDDLVLRITNYLMSKGCKRHIIGYGYTRWIIHECIEGDLDTGRVTEYYRKAAKEFDTTQSRVERAIRHMIESTGNKVVCSEFIANAVDDLLIGGYGNGKRAANIAGDC
jgi:hypothetical protein